MATYKKLLYSVGGGIINDAQHDAQNGSATVVIGLGGTGKDAIKRLKKEVYQRIKPDDDGAVARYKHIKYLCIDTDNLNLWNEDDFVGIDSNTEFFSIAGATAQFSTPTAIEMLTSQPHAKWLTGALSLMSDMGAGGVRQIGRYFLIAKSQTLLHTLTDIFKSVVAGLDPNTPGGKSLNIHILSGLGGGTGAGTFLDACYIIRHAVKNCAELNGKLVKLCGYFFMPDVNLAKVTDPDTRKYIQENSYAVMKELDYCMNLRANGDSWNQQYDGFRIENQQMPPVDICYLVSGMSVSGAVMEKAYDYAMGVVSDYVIQFISDSAITMDAHIANYAAKEKGFPKKTGGNYQYVIIGASHAIVPMREISTYLGSKLFCKMMDEWEKRVPGSGDMEPFCRVNHLGYANLLESLGGISIQIPSLSQRDYDKLPVNGVEDVESYILPDRLLTPFLSGLQAAGGMFQANAEALTKAWTSNLDLADNVMSTSISCRIYKALEAIVRDPKRGPIYAAKLLNGAEITNIINTFSGHVAQANQQKTQLSNDIRLSVNAVKRARDAYNNRGKLSNKNRLFDEVLQAIRNDMVKRAELNRVEYLEDVLSKVIEQLKKIYRDVFASYKDILMDLKQTFNENVIAISNLNDATTDPFTLPLFLISDVRTTLDKEVENIGIDTALQDFTSAFFLGARDIWTTRSEDKISKWVSDYLSKAFQSYTGLTLDAHIRSRYADLADGIDTEPLVERVKSDVITQLDHKADALFLLDAAKANHLTDPKNSITYCSAPMEAMVVKTAIQRYKNEHSYVMPVVGGTNRIFFLKSTPCVPIFAYGGIDQNFARYREANRDGMHLYEGSRGDRRNWKALLPNLRPYSQYYLMPEWKNNAERLDLVRDYGLAERAEGIIHAERNVETGAETDKYYIWRTPDYTPRLDAGEQKIEAVQKLFAQDMAGVPAAQLATMLAELQQKKEEIAEEQTALKRYKDGLIDYKIVTRFDEIMNQHVPVSPEIPPVSIRNDGAQEMAFEVRRDYVLDSPILRKYLREELEKVRKYRELMQKFEECGAKFDEKIAQIQAIVDGAAKEEQIRAQEMPIFFDALLSGIIKYNNPHQIIFENKDMWGLDVTPPIELNNLSLRPFGMIAPLYQAFENYWKLPEESRKLVHDKVNLCMMGQDEDGTPKDWSAEMKAAVSKLEGIYNKAYVQGVAQAISSYSQNKDIKDLYVSFLSRIATFKATFGL